jgi:hypothetical protein
MVEEAHKRGLSAEVHSTTIEGLRLSLEAGIDLIQHPELMTPRELPDSLVRTIVDRKAICSMLAGTITGEAWALHLKARDTAQKKLHEDDKKSRRVPRHWPMIAVAPLRSGPISKLAATTLRS